MNNSIYKKIAQKNGVSIKNVKKEIKKAIKIAYLNPNSYAQSIPRKNDIPTIDEVIAYSLHKIHK